MHVAFVPTNAAAGEGQIHVPLYPLRVKTLSMYRTTMEQSYYRKEGHHQKIIKISYINTALSLHWAFPMRVQPGAGQIGCTRTCRGTGTVVISGRTERLGTGFAGSSGQG